MSRPLPTIAIDVAARFMPEQEACIMRHVNAEHGYPDGVPMGVEPTAAHKDAAYAVARGRTVRLLVDDVTVAGEISFRLPCDGGVRVDGPPPAFDLAAIRARALADPGKPAGTCRWCDEPMADEPAAGCSGSDENAEIYCEGPTYEDQVADDRATLVAEVERLDAALDASEARWAAQCELRAEETGRASGLAAELDRIHEAIAAFVKRMGGTVHGQRNGDANEVLR